MTYAIICHDKPDHMELRQKTRPQHLEYIQKTGVVTTAGPFLNESGDMCGSLVVLDVENLEAAQQWATHDPYALAGLFESVFITQWRQVQF